MSSGARATPGELAQRLGVTLEQVLEAREAAGAYRAVSLDRPREDDEEGDGLGVAFGIEDPGFGEAEDSATVERLMRVLTEREREVLRLRFAEDLTQAEIGDAHRRLADARVADHPPGDRPAPRGRPGVGSAAMEHWDLRTPRSRAAQAEDPAFRPR